jgi:DNA polymerase-1
MGNELVLVDGHSLAYRAYYALPNTLKTSAGELTNAVYGFASMLFSVLEEEVPKYVIVTFDKGPSFRVREYEAYKAHREKMPDDMRPQMGRVRELVRKLGIPIVELEDYEADDLLGTLSRKAAAQGLDVLIVTGDRDALQLVDERVTVLTSGRRFSDTRRYTPEKVREKYGLTPEQLIDLKALMGDSSDNIPGVKGVGEKGATKMLKKYGTLDVVLEHVDELSTRYRNAFKGQREQALLSRKLGRIVLDVPVDLDLQSAARWKSHDRSELIDLMQTLEFRTLMNRLRKLPGGVTGAQGQLSLFGGEEAETPEAPGTYHLVADEAALTELVDRLREEAERLTFDTETTSTDVMAAELVGISLTHREGAAWYVPVRAPAEAPTVPLATVRAHLGPLFADPSLPKQGHNLKYDVEILRRAGLPVAGVAFDTMIAEWLINPNSPNLGLKNLAWARLGVRMTPIKELIGSGRSQKTMDEVALDAVVPYAGADADISHRLVKKLRADLEAHQQVELFETLEMPLVTVLADMELHGVKVDVDWLHTLAEDLDERLAQREAEIYELAGETFNVNSPQQLSGVLFDTLALPTQGLRKTKSGYYSTRAAVLERLASEHPIVEHVLAYRSLAKLKSTYVDSLMELVNTETGRIHTSFNQVATVTGRLSSSNPNLQNIPIRTEEGRRVRRTFVAEEGALLIGADYSQVELRVMAHVSEDAGLIEAFRRGEDVHATTAAAVFDVPLDEVDYDRRRIAKAVNFGLIYGQTAYGLSRQIGVSVEQAEAFIERYFDRFPQVKVFMERVQEEAVEKGYVETLLHRRRYFPELAENSRASHNRRQAALRMAINTPIQGTAADIIKLAMLRLHRRLREEQLAARMILQVHDELVLEAPEAERDAVIALLREAMGGAFALRVPLKVDVEVGANWQEMEPVVS